MAGKNSWGSRFRVVPAGAEDDDEDEDFALAEGGRGASRDGELLIENDYDGNDEEAMLFCRSGRRRYVRESITDAQHGWAFGTGDSDDDEDDHPTVEWKARNNRTQPGKTYQENFAKPDLRTDRELVDFLAAFDCEAVYEDLHSKGMTVFALLKSTEEEIGKILPGKENLAACRKLCYGLDKMRKHEWISNDAVNMLVNLLDASRLPPPRHDGTPHHNLEQAMEERRRAVRKAERDLGSVTQQVNAGSRLLGFLSSATSYLKKLFERESANHSQVGYVEDLEEIRINATNIVVAADKLKQSLTALRSVLISKSNCQKEEPPLATE